MGGGGQISLVFGYQYNYSAAMEGSALDSGKEKAFGVCRESLILSKPFRNAQLFVIKRAIREY